MTEKRVTRSYIPKLQIKYKNKKRPLKINGLFLLSFNAAELRKCKWGLHYTSYWLLRINVVYCPLLEGGPKSMISRGDKNVEISTPSLNFWHSYSSWISAARKSVIFRAWTSWVHSSPALLPKSARTEIHLTSHKS